MAEPKVDLVVEPKQSGSVIDLPLAPGTLGAAANEQLSLVLKVTNHEASSLHLNTVTVVFSGPPQAPGASIPADVTIAAGATATWYFAASDNILLPDPTPSSVTVGAAFDGFSDRATTTLPLAEYVCGLPGGAYLWPSPLTSLKPGEYWSGRSAAHGAAGGGVQLFAYDLGVVRWDDAANGWTGLADGGSWSKNEDYLVWGKPIVAMADGVVQSFANDKPTNPSPPADLSPPGPVEGNHFYIQHEEALVLYAHFQPGSLNPDLLTAGAPVTAGQQLGLAGNSGNSSGPHLHIHAIRGTAPWQGPPWPVPFRQIRTIDQSVFVPGQPSAPWVKVNGQGLPSVQALIAAPFVHGGPGKPVGKDVFEVAIDPLALILSNQVYVLLTLPDPAPIEVVVRETRRATARMSRRERAAALGRVKELQQQLEAIQRGLEAGGRGGG